MSVRTEIDLREIKYMGDRLQLVPESVRGQLRPALRAVGKTVRDTAAGNASWSSRIPAALRVRVNLTTGSKRMGITVYAMSGRAPHARPYEGVISDPFRHPVYGNRDVWVPQAARPFLFPAARQHAAEVERTVNESVTEALSRL